MEVTHAALDRAALDRGIYSSHHDGSVAQLDAMLARRGVHTTGILDHELGRREAIDEDDRRWIWFRPGCGLCS